MPETAHARVRPAAARPGSGDLGSAAPAWQAVPAPPVISTMDAHVTCGITGRLNEHHTRFAWQPSPGGVRHSEPQGPTMVDEWPLRNYLELGALPSAVPCARLHAQLVLWEWGLSAFGENAGLIVSELMTNAIQASLSTEAILPVRLCLSADRSRLLIQVQDSNRYPPTRTDVADDSESGRGLLIVEAISTKWGWHHRDDQGGKTVWALMEMP